MLYNHASAPVIFLSLGAGVSREGDGPLSLYSSLCVCYIIKPLHVWRWGTLSAPNSLKHPRLRGPPNAPLALRMPLKPGMLELRGDPLRQPRKPVPLEIPTIHFKAPIVADLTIAPLTKITKKSALLGVPKVARKPPTPFYGRCAYSSPKSHRMHLIRTPQTPMECTHTEICIIMRLQRVQYR